MIHHLAKVSIYEPNVDSRSLLRRNASRTCILYAGVCACRDLDLRCHLVLVEILNEMFANRGVGHARSEGARRRGHREFVY